jgi:ABC-2 type transport system ATP-binding protein
VTVVASARNLRKTFGERVAVDDVSFQIAAGETYGLLGPNGAGKSTAISMLAGLIEPDSGEAHVGGVRIRPRSTAGKGLIGLVPQELAIYPDLTAEENLRFFARLQGMSRAHTARRSDAVLELTGLSDRRKDRAGTYSGGMQRRLNIGIGLLHEPQLLILDEPTVGVDPQSRNAILEAVAALAGEGIATLYTTHYMEEAERLCDRVGILDEGRLLVEGTQDELLAMVGEQDRVRIAADGDLGAAAARIGALDAVTEATVGDGALGILVRDAPRHLSAIVNTIEDVRSVEIERPDLEAVFLHLTGKALRD